METLVMSGRPVADAYKEQIKEKVEAAQKSGKKVTLAILTVGQDPASFVYRKRLLKITESLGIGSRCVELPETATTEETVAAIRKLNEDPDVTGILPMMPMPKHGLPEPGQRRRPADGERPLGCLHATGLYGDAEIL